MPNEYLPSQDEKLSDWALNFATKAPASTSTTGLTAAEIKAISDAQIKFAADIIAHKQAVTATKALRTAKQTSRRDVTRLAQLYNARIQANPAVGDNTKVALGLNVHQKPHPVTPQIPTDLLVTGYDNGVNALKWKRGGNKPNTAYVIEACYPETNRWIQVGSVTRLNFEHTGQTPGVQVKYRIRARRRNEFSNPGNVVTAYDDTANTPTIQLKKAA